ncbi:MAG: 30S ribosomal protein S4 [Patescibacteria group bacterium]
MPGLNDKCTLCRREGEKLYLKGERCFTTKCAVVKRNYAPGVHGQTSKTKLTDYGKQLRDKQAAKRLYGLREKQFSNYVFKAMKKKENTKEVLVRLLESRLDNVIFRLGYAPSRAAARQLVGHGFIFVNGKKVDVASYQIRAKDIITINTVKANKKLVNELKERIKTKEVPTWIFLNKDKLEGKVIELPKLDEGEKTFSIQSVIEFYSR